VQRVQQWRRCNPGYWRQTAVHHDNPLQDHSLPQVIEKQSKTATLATSPLQEDLFTQPAVFIGLIAQLVGSTLQDDIVDTSHRLLRLGSQILAQPQQGETDGDQTSHRQGPRSPPAETV